MLSSIFVSARTVDAQFGTGLLRSLLQCHNWALLLIWKDQVGDLLGRFGGASTWTSDDVFVFSGDKVLSGAASSGPLVEEIRLSVLLEICLGYYVWILIIAVWQDSILHRLQLDDVLREIGLLPTRSTLLRTILLDCKCLALVEWGTFWALIQHTIILGDRLLTATLPAHLRLVGLVFALLNVVEKLVNIRILILILFLSQTFPHLRISNHLVRRAYQSFGACIMWLD